MKIVLTGVTGNLGHEILLYFLKEDNLEVIPVVRKGSLAKLSPYRDRLKTIIINDLLDGQEIESLDGVDAIVHCAGIVSFNRAGDSNQKMMSKVIRFAEKIKSPVYFVSTAFVYRPNENVRLNNSYETDKFASEQLLINSGLKYSIIRPSVIVGNSRNGQISNLSGYYSIVESFLGVISELKKYNKKLKCPRYKGFSNIIPVDFVAKGIAEVVLERKFGDFYMTNPNPQKSSDLLKQTLEFFHLSDSVDLVDVDYDDLLMSADLTEPEIKFYKFNLHFKPYWSIDYPFPSSSFKIIPPVKEFLPKILGYFLKIYNHKV